MESGKKRVFIEEDNKNEKEEREEIRGKRSEERGRDQRKGEEIRGKIYAELTKYGMPKTQDCRSYERTPCPFPPTHPIRTVDHCQ